MRSFAPKAEAGTNHGAANAAALNVYRVLRAEGTQERVIDTMQSRMELYDYLGYHEFEQILDRLYADE